MLSKTKLEGYELITLIAKKQIPVGAIITAIFKDNLIEVDNKLIVKTDGDGYYLRWEIDDFEVGNSLFTDDVLYFRIED